MVAIIERKIHFTKTNNIYDKTDFKYNNLGELLAYNEMLVDVKTMRESDFTNKYLEIVHGISKKYEDEKVEGKNEIERLSGYNNAIVSILKLIDPIQELDIENDFE